MRKHRNGIIRINGYTISLKKTKLPESEWFWVARENRKIVFREKEWGNLMVKIGAR